MRKTKNRRSERDLAINELAAMIDETRGRHS